MKSNKSFLLLISLVIVLATSCYYSKDKNLVCTEGNTVKMVQHAVDYFYFKKGSWCVYVCKQTGKRDSVWVGSVSTEISNALASKRDCDCSWGKCYEDRSVAILSTTSVKLGRQDFLFYGMGYSSLERKGNDGLFEVRESFDLYDNHYPGYKLDYDGSKNFLPVSGLNATLETIDSLTINNIQFKEVMKYSYPGVANPPDWYYEAYYAKNIHLIKYMMHKDSSVWELEKYNIVK